MGPLVLDLAGLLLGVFRYSRRAVNSRITYHPKSVVACQIRPTLWATSGNVRPCMSMSRPRRAKAIGSNRKSYQPSERQNVRLYHACRCIDPVGRS